MPQAISLPERGCDTGWQINIVSVINIKSILLCFCRSGRRPTVGPARTQPFACAIIYFGAFLRYCFVRANNCDVINEPTKLHSRLVVDATKLISKSFTSITPVLELCKGTKEQILKRNGRLKARLRLNQAFCRP